MKTVGTDSWKGTTFTVQDDLSLFAAGNRPNKDIYTIELTTDLDQTTAIRIEALPDERLPGDGPGRSPLSINPRLSMGDFLLSEVELFDGKSKIELQNPTANYHHKDCEPEKTLDGLLDTGWGIGLKRGKPHHIVFQLKQPIKNASEKQLTLKLHQIYIHNMILGRFRISATADDGNEIVSSGLPAEVEEIIQIPESKLSEQDKWLIEREFLLNAPELEKQQKELDQLRYDMPKYDTTLVMQERIPEVSRTTHLRERGEFLKPKEVVSPGVPALFHSLPEGAKQNRMQLAKWLVHPDNPLVARVTVNRQWQAFFGKGIVRTTEDFGTQSSTPTHPKLLDWLATEFVQNGWSMKSLHKLIVMSATYRQQSQVSEKLLQRDPENNLLARGPRIRVDAELVRDIALTASGLLNRKIGGPSVFPSQPAGVIGLAYGRFQWKEETGPNRYRRGMYTFAKRTAPYAMFGTFDGPSGETCVVKRNRSNTPLQALTMLNDQVFLESSRALAKNEMERGIKSHKMIQNIIRRILTRKPDQQEIKMLLNFYSAQKKRFETGELKAESILGHPEEPKIDLNVWAAWTTVVRAILNFDETITKG